jgi:DNA polymerase-3 subunit delta'
MKFNEVIGQHEAKQRLMQMVDEDRIPHALLFCGPQGAGKMALAMAFASYLLGDRDDEKADAHAQAMLAKWAHPDLIFTFPAIKPDGAASGYQPVSDDFIPQWQEMLRKHGAYFSHEDWVTTLGTDKKQTYISPAESNSLIHKLSMKSSQGGYKINIIWLPEKLRTDAANKLLKLIEEPPTETLFIMVSEEPEKLLETIRSRTQRIDIKKLSADDIKQALIERRGIEEDAAQRIARVANGNWLKAIEELNAGSEKMLFHDLFVMLMRLAYQRNIRDLKKWSETIAEFGREKQKRMLIYFSHLIRENFFYNFHNPELIYMTEAEEKFAKNFARFINEDNVIGISQLIERTLRDISQNANAKISFFDFTLKIIVLLIPRRK